MSAVYPLHRFVGILCVVAALGGLGVVAPSAALAHPADSLTDADHDRVDDPPVGPDNCAGEFSAYNPDQLDTDRDGRGDACDSDDDGDAVDDAVDNCPLISNGSQGDIDGDGQGNPCDGDDDGDGLVDNSDNCPAVANPAQADADADAQGDACETAAPASSGGAGGAGGGGGSAAGPGPSANPGGGTTGAGPAPDTRAPSVRLTVAARHRLGELRAGLAVAVRCSEACTVMAALAPGRGPRLGTGEAALAASGSTYAFVTFDAAAWRRLRRTRRMVAVVRVVVTDPAGNRTRATRSITIRR